LKEIGPPRVNARQPAGVYIQMIGILCELCLLPGKVTVVQLSSAAALCVCKILENVRFSSREYFSHPNQTPNHLATETGEISLDHHKLLTASPVEPAPPMQAAFRMSPPPQVFDRILNRIVP
jgi:hypothetical protein